MVFSVSWWFFVLFFTMKYSEYNEWMQDVDAKFMFFL